MNKTLTERIKIFLWGMFGFASVSVCAYLVNISDIREIDPYKIATIIVVVSAGYVVNQYTKYLNTKQ